MNTASTGGSPHTKGAWLKSHTDLDAPIYSRHCPHSSPLFCSHHSRPEKNLMHQPEDIQPALPGDGGRRTPDSTRRPGGGNGAPPGLDLSGSGPSSARSAEEEEERQGSEADESGNHQTGKGLPACPRLRRRCSNLSWGLLHSFSACFPTVFRFYLPKVINFILHFGMC